MARRSRSYKGSRVPVASAVSVSCTELLVVDQTPFLKKALSTCKRLRKELDKKQALLADFEGEDRAAFQRWLNSTHGATLTEVRELREEVSAYQFILHHLSHCAYYSFEEVPKLYQELFKLKKKGMLYSYEPPQAEDESYEEEDEGDDEDWDNPFGANDDEDWEKLDDDMREFFDRMFGGGGSGPGDGRGERRAESARKAANDAQLKTCYRQLAKRLHPDHSELEERVREKRWHEIQEAYQNGDLEGLLRVEAICDMDEEGLSVKLGLARLRDLAAYHKSHLLPIRNALRAAKKDIAFGFAKKGPSPQVAREIAGDLKFERIDLKAAVTELAESAKGIRNEVEAHLREREIRAAQAARRRERAEADKSRRQPDSKRGRDQQPVAARAAQPKSSKAADPADDRQMTFF